MSDRRVPLTDAPRDGTQYARTSGAWTAVSSGLANIVEDTTPQLGGTLDSNGYDISLATTGLTSPALAFSWENPGGTARSVTLQSSGYSFEFVADNITDYVWRATNAAATVDFMFVNDSGGASVYVGAQDDTSASNDGAIYIAGVPSVSGGVYGATLYVSSTGLVIGPSTYSYINTGVTYIQVAPTTFGVWFTGGQRVWLRDNSSLRISDTTDADYADFDHDGIDFNTTFTNTTDWNITGITAIQAGAVDADFDAITATSYGGITEANLVDKSAAETITGAWALPSTSTIDSITATNLLDKSASETISGAYTFSGAGVFSTSLNAVPLARSVTATGNTASTDYGIVIRFTSGSAQTFTLDGDPPTNAVVLLDNSAGAAWTIAASTSLIWAKDASTGNRTLADDGVAVAIHRGSGTWIINGSDLLT